VFPDVEQGATILRGNLARPLEQRGGFRRFATGKQMYLDHPAGGDFPAAENAKAVASKHLQQFVFFVEVHESLALCLAPSSRKLRLRVSPPMVEYILARSAWDG
jgi:hypothetical protein